MQDALNYGYKSLVIPYSGYFHTIPRIIAYISSFFPSIYIPYFIVFSCFIITIYTFSSILKKEYEWFIPDIRYRGILLLLLAMVPGSPEAFGNIANLHWILWVYLGLLGLRSLDYKYKIWEIGLVFLIVFSEGATLTLLPLFCARLLFQLLAKRSSVYLFQEIIIISLIILVAWINFIIRTSLSTTDLPVSLLFEVIKKTLLAEFLSYPWLYNLPYTNMSEYWFLPTMYIAVFVGIIILKNFSFKCKIIIPLIFFVSVLLIAPMISVSRNTPNVFIIHPSTWNDFGSWAHSRYAFLTCVGSYIFWIWICSLISTQKPLFAKYLSILLVVLCVTFCWHSYWFIQPSSPNYWTNHADKIDKVRNHSDKYKIIIPIQPTGWVISVGNGKKEIQIEEKK